MVEPVRIDIETAPQIAAFTRVACPYDLLSTDSVERSIFEDPDPSIALGVYDGGLEAFGVGVVRGEVGWVKFLATHPREQKRGLGSQLLARIEAFCAEQGAKQIHVGTCAPYYVVPGIDVRSTEAICFFSERGYERIGDAVNLGVRLNDLPEATLPTHTASDEDLAGLMPWVEEHHPNWINELTRGVRLGTCIVHRDVGFACYDVNRSGWFGPIASHPDERGKGIGGATLVAALQRMRSIGHERAEIAWAVAFPFYLKTVGARISRVFWCYRKKI